MKPRTQRQLERRRAALFATNLTSAKGTHRDDELDGLHETFYENGQLFSRGNRKYGKKDGLWELFHANGELRHGAYALNGKGEGLWDYIDENGKLIRIETFVDDYGNMWRGEKEVEYNGQCG